jgi:hypothetical protein
VNENDSMEDDDDSDDFSDDSNHEERQMGDDGQKDTKSKDKYGLYLRFL